MRAITHCPSCQTQFFVTEEQLNQHQGQVRCGQCLHVFDAKEQFIEDAQSDITIDLVGATNHLTNASTITSAPANNSGTVFTESKVAAIDNHKNAADNTLSSIHALAIEDKPYNFEDEVKVPEAKVRSASQRTRKILNPLFILILSLTAIAQSLYFLRNDIAIAYPAIKPTLVQACQHLACHIDLPKKIELIIIDDSDMQEDTTYVGLMHLSSTLINQAAFSQAYPNVEITLTDIDDKPKLRRIFKPHEYLPEHADIANGIAAGEEVKLKLAMTTAGITVAGYRIFVTY
jgi:predicted Zn finger-like uncharacterized protein